MPKVRLFAEQDLVEGLYGTQIGYQLYFDAFSEPDTIGFKPGFASVNIKFQDWPVELIFGQTLDPITYQFPAPAALPVLKYPKASMNEALSLGAFARYQTDKVWIMAGYVNGESGSAIGREFTSRIEVQLPLNLSADVIYKGGNDQHQNRREYYGASLSYKNAGLWLNAGRNYLSFVNTSYSQWLWGTYDLSEYLQIVGLYETQEDLNGWAGGLNINLTSKTVARICYQKRAEKDCKAGWGIILQQKF